MRISDWSSDVCSSDLRIDYNVNTDIVVLTGAVVVEQERGTLRGERVTYNLTSGELDSGGNGGRIQMKILPKDKTTNKEGGRSEEHTSELQSLMRISYAVFCLKKKINT